MFKHTVEGEYVLSGKLTQIEYFETTFTLEEANPSVARSIIQNGLLEDKMRKEFKNFKRVRTSQIVKTEKVEDEKAKSDTDVELEKLLAEAGNLGCVPVNYTSYKSDDMRKRQLAIAIKRRHDRQAKADKAAGKESSIDKGYVD